MNRAIDTGIAANIGAFSDAMQVDPGSRLLVTAGTVGVRPDGTCPESFAEQAEQAWANIARALEQAGMTVNDLIKVNQYLLRREDLAAYREVRARYASDPLPASTLVFVAALVRPEWLIEIEAWAAKAP